MPRIYTRTGDRGETSLWRHRGSPRRVPKDDPRVEAYGTLDELNACLGWLRAVLAPQSQADVLLAAIQRQLFDVGAELATPDLPEEGYRIGTEAVDALERAIDGLEEGLPPLRRFILPVGGEAAGRCHLARTVARRAERRVTALARQERVNPELQRYLNRLSDLLFVLARQLARDAGQPETEVT